MDIVITTPNGKLPSSPNPVEGVDYFVQPGAPQAGNLIKRGTQFMQYFPPVNDVAAAEATPTDSEAILTKLDELSARISSIEDRLP